MVGMVLIKGASHFDNTANVNSKVQIIKDTDI